MCNILRTLSFLLFCVPVAGTFAQDTTDGGSTDGSRTTPPTPAFTESASEAVDYGQTGQITRTNESSPWTTIVQVDAEQGKLYNGPSQVNGNSSIWLGKWYSYAFPTMFVNAERNNMSTEIDKHAGTHRTDHKIQISYGQIHSPITIQAPRGWKITKVTVDGKALGSTAKVISQNGRLELNGEGTGNRPGKAWDAVESHLGFYTQPEGSSNTNYEVSGGNPITEVHGLGTVYAYFLPDGYTFPTNETTGTPYTQEEAIGTAAVNHFAWTPETPTDQFVFHMNGDNTGIEATLQVHMQQCDSITEVTFHIYDETGKDLTPTEGLKRTMRLDPNGAATIPFDFDRDFCNYTWLTSDKASSSAQAAATEASTSKTAYLRLTRSSSYPFRIANIPTGENALDQDAVSSDLRAAGFYYVGIGGDHYFNHPAHEAESETEGLLLEDDTRDISDEWFAFVAGDAFNGWKIVNFNHPEKFLTADMTTEAEATVYGLSFKETLGSGERNLWIPMSAMYDHSTGHHMNSNYNAAAVHMRDNAFFLAPVLPDAGSFKEDNIDWQYTALKQTADGLVARTGQKGRYTNGTWTDDERDEHSRVLLHEITDVDMRVVDERAVLAAGEDYSGESVWKDWTRLKHMRELQNMSVSTSAKNAIESDFIRDYCSFFGEATGTYQDQLRTTTTGEDGTETTTGGLTLKCRFELFSITPEADKYTSPVEYFIKVAPRCGNTGAQDKAHAFLFCDKTTGALALTAPAEDLHGNTTRQDDHYRWFITGNPYKGFTAHNAYNADGEHQHKVITVVNGQVLLVDENANTSNWTWRPDSAYTQGRGQDDPLLFTTEAMSYDNTLKRGATWTEDLHLLQCFNILENDVRYRQTGWPALTKKSEQTSETETARSIALREDGADALSEFILIPTTEDVYVFVLRQKGDESGREYGRKIFSNPGTTDMTFDLNQAANPWIREYCTYSLTDQEGNVVKKENDEELLDFGWGTNTRGSSDRTMTVTVRGTQSSLYNEYILYWDWDGPFELSTEDNKVWYSLKTGAGTQAEPTSYVTADGQSSVIRPAGWHNETVGNSYKGLDANYGPKYVLDGKIFAFYGNPYDGFIIRQKRDESQCVAFNSNLNLSTNEQKWTLMEQMPRTEEGKFNKRFIFRDDSNNRYMYSYGFATRTLENFYNGTEDMANTCKLFGREVFSYAVEDPRITLKQFFDDLLEAPRGAVYGLSDKYYDLLKGKTEQILATDPAAEGYKSFDEWYELACQVRDFANDNEGVATRNAVKANTAYRIISVARTFDYSLESGCKPGDYYLSMGVADNYADKTALYIRDIRDKATALKNPSSVFMTGDIVNQSGKQCTISGLHTQGLYLQALATPARVGENAQEVFIDVPKANQAAVYSPYALIGTTNGSTRTTLNNWNARTVKGTNNGEGDLYNMFYVVPAEEIELTVGGSGYATAYLDFPVVADGDIDTWYVGSIEKYEDGSGLAKSTSIDGGTTIPAGIPFVMGPSTPAASVVLAIGQAEEAQAIGNNQLSGIYLPAPKADIPLEAGQYLYTFGLERTSGEAGFWPYLGTTLSANKAYLLFIPTSGSEAAGIRLFHEDETTGIDTVGTSGQPAAIYDLSGRRIDQPTRSGLYIVNGKKIYIKAN